MYKSCCIIEPCHRRQTYNVSIFMNKLNPSKNHAALMRLHSKLIFFFFDTLATVVTMQREKVGETNTNNDLRMGIRPTERIPKIFKRCRGTLDLGKTTKANERQSQISWTSNQSAAIAQTFCTRSLGNNANLVGWKLLLNHVKNKTTCSTFYDPKRIRSKYILQKNCY